MGVYFQLGTIIGAVLGWIDGRPGRGNRRAAIAAFPIAGTLLLLTSILAQHELVFTSLGAIALGYGLAFLIRRARGEHQ